MLTPVGVGTCWFDFVLTSCLVIQVDSYGTQQPIALLKLLLDRGGLYDRGKDLIYKILKDLGFIAAMGKAGGGRNEVDSRFVSLFSVFSIPFPAVESLQLIYASIIKGHTKVSVSCPPILGQISSTHYDRCNKT